MCAERLGVLGGTFDPVHLGHLASAAEIAEAFSLDAILLVLSARPPHKDGASAAPADLRFEMLKLAVAEAEASGRVKKGLLRPSDIELRRDGPSWTVDTLRQLASEHRGSELHFILGIDAYEEIETWKQPGELLPVANIIVTSRPGRASLEQAPIPPIAARPDARYDPVIGAYVHTSGHWIKGHNIRGIEVSATEIRQRARSGTSLSSLTGDAVARFIREHGLYGSDAAAPNPSGQVGAGKNCKE